MLLLGLLLAAAPAIGQATEQLEQEERRHMIQENSIGSDGAGQPAEQRPQQADFVQLPPFDSRKCYEGFGKERDLVAGLRARQARKRIGSI